MLYKVRLISSLRKYMLRLFLFIVDLLLKAVNEYSLRVLLSFLREFLCTQIQLLSTNIIVKQRAAGLK